MKNSGISKEISEIKLYDILIKNSSDGLILADKKTLDICLINDNAMIFLDIDEKIKLKRLSDIFNAEQIEEIFEGRIFNTQINGMAVKMWSAEFEEYIWIFVDNYDDVIRAENISKKTMELNQELMNVFSQYGDETLMITDGRGIIEFAGEQIAETCGVSKEFFIGRSAYEMEKQGMFSPSVSVKVIESRLPQAVMQKTKKGKTVVAVGAPILDEFGNIDKVISVTRSYSMQLRISKMIADLGERADFKNEEKSDNEKFIVTCSDKMFEIKALINMVADTKATVLITGETGAGKEVLANYIYNLSNRKEKPFIKVNCGTIPNSIVESELFGYEEGSFTGASKGGKMGLVEAANGGTLFLDEISELPIEQQVKLLRVIQEKKLIRVGGTETVDLDIRIIAATNKNLGEQVAKGEFREDLYYRLNVISIDVPPLRKRKEDISLLARYFFGTFCDMYGKEMQLSNNVIAAFERYSWPGNVRELENMIERLVLTTPKPVISIEDLPENIRTEESKNAVKVDKIIKIDEAIKMLEKDLIKMALDEYGTTVKAAEALGVNQSTVSRKMAQYNLK